jgi:hypothetical protein
VKRGWGGFKAEFRRTTELRRGRPLGLSMAREEGGVIVCEEEAARDINQLCNTLILSIQILVLFGVT